MIKNMKLQHDNRGYTAATVQVVIVTRSALLFKASSPFHAEAHYLLSGSARQCCGDVRRSLDCSRLSLVICCLCFLQAGNTISSGITCEVV